MEQQKKKFHLTTSEKVIIGCTVAVVVAGVIVYKESEHIKREQERIDLMLHTINAAAVMSSQAIYRGNKELVLGNQMLRSIIKQNLSKRS